jgi:flagellar M-ring protein FliF
MKALIEQFLTVFRAMPNSKKITMVVVVVLVLAGFAVMFFWANKVDYQVLYSSLSSEDAGNIVAKLREKRIPYELSGGGSTVLVPAEHVYELRLSLAKEGVPSGGHVGFEIFDETNFSTTEFVQRLNYQRALQGELVRTISEFREVEHARVLLVMPKDSLFVEDSKPPSASVFLKLRSSLSSDKVAGIVHLVANAVEGLSSDQVTVVDASGRVLYKGANEGDQTALFASNKLEYQHQVETQISRRVESMLEGIVGESKAIVRVSADIDFDQVDFSEEKFDPDSSVVRSRQRRIESSARNRKDESSVRLENTGQGTVPVQGGESGGASSRKEDETVNYEINRISRRVIKPSGALKRVSVAAVVDGTYEIVSGKDGSETKKYIPRTKQELEEFDRIVKRAMGFDADRADQVYVSSFPLSMDQEPSFEDKGIDWLALVRQYARTIVNLLLVFLIFVFVVRPLLRSVKTIGTGTGSVDISKELTSGTEEKQSPKLPKPAAEKGIREKTLRLAQENSERTEQLVRGWLHEEP